MTPRYPPLLRELTPADVGRVVALTSATSVFRADELLIAEEVVHDATHWTPKPGEEGAERPYYALGAEVDGVLMGWVCWGRTPCTEGTWDLYWLAVDPAAHGRGIGSALVDEMERRLAGVARLVSVDTSGRADYGPTRAFYAARGYDAVARVPDFYAPGDDQVIFTKRLPAR
ncbi:MAG: GNAT family N-acetyltransferase [Gemmatimonadetes bacterium]|nr:GNAT family N-acetyltransferase [Gemmatimonadota bacterium]